MFAGRLLGEFGADVIRVDAPEGDLVRRRPPFLDGEAGLERSLHHLHFNAMKRSVALDVRTPDGADLLRRLTAVADVLIETERPGVMDALGIGYEALRSTNPSLIYATVTPFGQEGPLRDYKGSDLIGVASGGLMWLNGFPEDPPVQPGAEQAYHMASLVAAASIATAIAGRGRGAGGAGQRVDVSIQEVVSVTTLQHASPNVYAWQRLIPKRQGLATTRGNRIFECADGQWVTFIVLNGPWEELVGWFRGEGLGEHLLGDEWLDKAYRIEHAREISDVIEQLIARHPREYIFREGQRRRMRVMPVNTIDDLVRNEHLQARDYFVEYEHPSTGRRLIDSGVAAHLSHTPAFAARPAPELGEHTHEVLGGLLGLSGAEFERLSGDGVIR